MNELFRFHFVHRFFLLLFLQARAAHYNAMPHSHERSECSRASYISHILTSPMKIMNHLTRVALARKEISDIYGCQLERPIKVTCEWVTLDISMNIQIFCNSHQAITTGTLKNPPRGNSREETPSCVF